jgi:hypothetical protein
VGLGPLEFIVIGVPLLVILTIVIVPLTIAWRSRKAQERRKVEQAHHNVERADNV